MGNNNLYKIENTLRSIAKRYKSVKYSLGLAILFLMMGVGAFSEEVNNPEAVPTREEIATSKENLKNSVGSLQSKIDSARAENEKGLTGLKLELIQLMEQGDQVVKSPWASWQFGLNYMYNHWGAAYKGHGDKKKNQLLARDASEDPLARFTASSASNSSYGTTDLALVSEPPVEIEVSAGIRPKDVNKAAPTFSPKAPAGALPPFDPKIIQPPKAPADITVTPPGEVQANLTGSGANPEVFYYYWNGNRGAISQITLKAGTFNIKPGNIINVNGYQAQAYPGTTPLGTAPSNGDQTVSQEFFHTLLNVPYSEYSKDVVINNNRAGFTLINLETQGVVTGDLSNRETDGYITSAKKTTLKAYQTYSGIKGQDSTELLFINKGTVNLNADNTTYLFTTSHNQGEFRTNYIDNEGTISAKGENSVIIKHSPDTSQAKAWIYSNNGTMKAEGKGSVVYGAAYSNLEHGRAAFINDGTIEVTGESAIGVILPKDSANSKLADGHLIWLKKPILLKGTKSMGFVAQNTNISNIKNLVKFNINATKAIGILQDVQDAGTAKTAGKIEIGGDSSESMGIYAKQGTLELIAPHADSGETESSIELKGGNNNIGIYAKGTSTVNFDGIAKITGGEGQKIALATEGSTINLKRAVTAGDKATNNFVKDAVPLYATGNNSKVTLAKPEKFLSYLSENSVAAYAKDKGKIDMNNTALPSTPNINIKSTSNKGIGLFAKDGGIINAQKHYMKIENGSTGISSIGSNGGVDSNVDFEGGKLDYNGEGYALYAKDGGKIKFTNGNLILRGKSTAMELNASGTNPINISNTKITVMSNDVIVFNILNATAPINVSNLAGNISSIVGSGINVAAGTEGGQTFNKYKLAALDGGTVNIDVDINKADGPTTVSGYYFQRFLGQRLKTNVNSNVTARLTTAQAHDLYKGQVVGIEANSSKNASNNTETQVNVAAGKTIDVARTDGTDKGGVGVFVNYGLVNNKGTISVEKDSTANSDGVGIYSANGSEVTNEGTIDVAGKNGIGILGIAYRTDASGSPKVNEFGGKPGEGKVTILNKGKVTLNGEGATGIFAKNNKAGATLTNAIATNDTTGNITLSGNKAVGMSGEKATLTNKGTIDIKGQESTGMFAKDSSEMTNNGTINLVNSTSADKPNIGMFTEDKNTVIHNNKDIVGGNNTYGIYGKIVNLGAAGKIKVGDNSVGIFSNGKHAAGSTPTINLVANSKIEVGKNESVGVFTTGENQVIKSDGDMKIGDSSYGFVIRGKGTKLFTNNTNGVTLGNDAVFAYSADTTGNIENKTTLTATGSKNYGLYAAGVVNNLADINFGTGVGNVGIYSIGGGNATNGTPTIRPTIRVSKSDTVNKLYGIGMAAGYTDDNGVTRQTGTITNYGTIKVEKDNGIGMYATGSGSKAINRGDIELSGKGTTGMYLDNNAIGENYGTIKTAPNITKDGIIGVVAMNGAIIKNYGTIEIKGNGNTGIFLSKGKNEGTVPQDLDGSKGLEEKKQLPTGKKVSGIDIVAPGDGTATIKRNGRVITPTYVDTVTSSPNAPKVRSGATELDLRAAGLNNIPSMTRVSEIGMYVDTSGVNYTNPIKGLEKLTNLKKVNLIFGTEASRYTSSKDIKIGQNILSPYNKVISTLSAGGGKKFTINSASLTWIATGTQNSDDTFNAVYLSKIPYTSFAKDKDTYNFMDGLEQRYGVEGVGSREKELFNKLNAIGKGEPVLFAQAVDEMKGHQYSNIQQRVQATGIILDKEFDYLRSEWQTVTKDSNKIKTFGTRGEYKTDTAGVIDYKYNAYGVAYVHENEDIRLGKGIGWYTGIVHNRLKFKDLGKSKEEQLQGKIGLFKSIPFDENNSLNWTVSGNISVGYNRMNRKFLVVDEIFNAKGKYYNYGIGIKNEIGKEFRLSEDFSLRPYAALNLEYGRTTKIREKSGEMKLEVKANDYISVKPEVGTELAFRHYFGAKTLKAGLSVAYEDELGRVANAKNKAKVAHTNADWYNLRGEKEDRRGNVKFDLNVGLDNQRYGVTANVGYDTKGENVRGGLGLRVIF
ncbi:autotransporter domain-containing protein [Fusobacterium nucleatum]|uniref:Autotransporter domain-containing protein n=1 Tax=Fusobacterium nucleatum TaxID=851 RepID=A0A2N6TFK5_FUSNU|nr:autotransporter-associated N-terminal domain-containing protein [Fusobacterium nucleatum]PMC68111.1 autotransporter domain-containing protein [Fusobacterium nucleatum]